jgi:hypothetical protein
VRVFDLLHHDLQFRSLTLGWRKLDAKLVIGSLEDGEKLNLDVSWVDRVTESLISGVVW